MKKIYLNLCKESIIKAQDELRKYKQEIRQKAEMLVIRMTDHGVQFAKQDIAQLDAIETGELQDSMIGYYDVSLKKGFVIANCPHAAFVEFGTGIRGKNSPHVNPPPGWSYDSNDHGEGGWYYWDGDRKRWTAGMGSRPFMYHTSEELRKVAEQIAKEVFQ